MNTYEVVISVMFDADDYKQADKISEEFVQTLKQAPAVTGAWVSGVPVARP